MASQKLENPLRVLRSAVNKDVLVKVKDGNSFLGRLIFTDSTMNIVMVDTDEVTDDLNTPLARYGTVLIRGSQILYIVVDYKRS
ncbi:MAG: Sm ribonucleo [Zestosphaera tikiterensis]|uniref:Sm ribonucleo n=1 Tax=Zestosphaera tikiterensis TaxID=1973259 RepID=A0A2R7Y5M3_9CREN|nr:MAG: Sm ribonucleo [Zestosphaera tikiterensis]